METKKVTTMTFQFDITESIEEFLKMITGKEDAQEAAEIFGVSCVSFGIDPVVILNTVKNGIPGYTFIENSETSLEFHADGVKEVKK